VALADKYDPKYVDFENENWFASRKLDGVRCLIRKEGNEITAYSRQGKEFETLKNVKDDIAKIPGDFVFDGEICLMDEDGNEDFQGIMKQIRRKDHTIENPKYIIFDCLTLEEFDTKKGSKSLFWRLDRISINYSIYKYISLLNQDLVDDNEELLEMTKQAEISGYEGLMLRKDCGYQGKRTRNLLKVKKMNDAEYKVVDATYGPFRHVKDGKEIESIVLSAVIIEHKGNKVNVGSGFSFDQRKLFIQHPDEIIGKTITVQYFEESKNQNGEYSLRFPEDLLEEGRLQEGDAEKVEKDIYENLIK
jgi:DNA ligase-1